MFPNVGESVHHLKGLHKFEPCDSEEGENLWSIEGVPYPTWNTLKKK
jgi:hypothetical protein